MQDSSTKRNEIAVQLFDERFPVEEFPDRSPIAVLSKDEKTLLILASHRPGKGHNGWKKKSTPASYHA